VGGTLRGTAILEKLLELVLPLALIAMLLAAVMLPWGAAPA